MADISEDLVRTLRYRLSLVVSLGNHRVSEPYAERDYLEKLRWVGADALNLVAVLDEYARLRGFSE